MSAILFTMISTVIIGAILYLILNLILSSKPNEEITENRLRDEVIDRNTGKVSESKTQSVKWEDQLSETGPHEDLYVTQDVIDVNENKLNAPEVIGEEITKSVMNEVNKHFTNYGSDISLTYDEPVVETEVTDEESGDKQEMADTEDVWGLNETQILTHLNKSRPKKVKSRLSVKVIFDANSSDLKSDQTDDELVIKKDEQLVDNLFDNLDSDSGDEHNVVDTTDDNQFDGNQSSGREKCVTDSLKDSFEEITTGDYKKFDEFSDYFKTETQKHEMTRNVSQTTSVKSFSVTLDNSQPLIDPTIDELFKRLDSDGSAQLADVFEEKYSQRTSDYESVEVRKRVTREALSSVDSKEQVSHTKTTTTALTERSLSSSSSLSRISLDDINATMRSSKSPLSETIDNATKPLRSSPTLGRRPRPQTPRDSSSTEPEDEPNDASNHSPRRVVAVPMFGSQQKLLLNEMINKDFRRSLKPRTDHTISEQ